MPAVPLTPYRRGLIASVKIAQKDMGLDDATYRALLGSLTGRRSAKDCTNAQLVAVLAEFRLKGWTPRPRTGKPADPLTPLRKKIAAQLAALDKPAAYAEGILERMYGPCATLGAASRAQLTACISALTRQQARTA